MRRPWPQADAGIALGGIGADLAAEAGDLIVLGEPLRVLPDLFGLSRATIAIIRQNIIGFAFGLNAVAMLSATFGILGPVAAAILHQVGSLLVLLNSMRLLVFGDWAELPPFRQLRALGRLDRPARRPHRPRAGVGVALAAPASDRGRGRRCCCSWSMPRAAGRAIGPDEVGLLRRFGRYRGLLEPGLHLRWPYPIERVTTGRASTGFAASRSAFARPRIAGDASRCGWESTMAGARRPEPTTSALLLTGDGRYVELAATLQYSIDPTDPDAVRRFVFDVADGETAAGPLAESVGPRRRRPPAAARPPDGRPARGGGRRGPPAAGAAGRISIRDHGRGSRVSGHSSSSRSRRRLS